MKIQKETSKEKEIKWREEVKKKNEKIKNYSDYLAIAKKRDPKNYERQIYF